MKKALTGVALSAALLSLAPTNLHASTQKANPADFTIQVHVSSAQYVSYNGALELLTVTINGKHYQLEGPTSSSKAYTHGNGLLNLGDYPAKLTTDTHMTSYESFQVYVLLMSDGTTRPFTVFLQSE